MPDSYIADRLRLVDMLEELLASNGVLLFSRYDGDYHGDFVHDGRRKVSESPTLVGCVEELTEHPRRKVCVRKDCIAKGRPLPLSRFSPDHDAADGHQAECKDCASKRIAKYGKRKKAEKESKSN